MKRNKTSKKELRAWIKETAKNLTARGYIVIPTKIIEKGGKTVTKPMVSFAGRAESLPLDQPEWKDAAMVSIVLGDTMLLDYDGNHGEAMPVADLEKLVGVSLSGKEMQSGSEGKSLHWFFSIPGGFDAKKYQHHKDKWQPCIDVKTGNQLAHIKPGKTESLPPIGELPPVPKVLLKAISRTIKEKPGSGSGRSKGSGGGSGSSSGTRPAKTKQQNIDDLSKIPPYCSGQAWREIVWGLNYHYSGDDTGLELARKWSRGDYWKGNKDKWPDGKPWGYQGDGWTEEQYYRGNSGKGNPATIGKVHHYANNPEEAGLCEEAPRKKKGKKKKNRASQEDFEILKEEEGPIAFPPLDTSYMPKMVKMVHKEFLKQSTSIIPQFVYMAAEFTLQFLAGNIPTNPMRGRTTAVPMIGAAESGSGKDTNSKDIIIRFCREFMKARPDYKEHMQPLFGGCGSQTSAASILESIVKHNQKVWLSTEASTIIKVLAAEDKSGHGSSSLTTVLNQIYDGYYVNGLSRSGKQVEGMDKPHLPICWLIQTNVIRDNFTQDLLSLGALGRFEYYIDLTEYEVKNTYSAGVKLPPFGGKFFMELEKFFDNRKEENGQEMIKFESVETAQYFGSWKVENLSKEKYRKDDGLRAIVARIEMSMEKRLSYYAYFGDKEITRAMVEGVRPYMDYQLKVKERIYFKEVRGANVEEILMSCVMEIQNGDKFKYHLKDGLAPWNEIRLMFQNRVRTNPKFNQMKSMDIRRCIEEMANHNGWISAIHGKGTYYGLPKLAYLRLP